MKSAACEKGVNTFFDLLTGPGLPPPHTSQDVFCVAEKQREREREGCVCICILLSVPVGKNLPTRLEQIQGNGLNPEFRACSGHQN